MCFFPLQTFVWCRLLYADGSAGQDKHICLHFDSTICPVTSLHPDDNTRHGVLNHIVWKLINFSRHYLHIWSPLQGWWLCVRTFIFSWAIELLEQLIQTSKKEELFWNDAKYESGKSIEIEKREHKLDWRFIGEMWYARTNINTSIRICYHTFVRQIFCFPYYFCLFSKLKGKYTVL